MTTPDDETLIRARHRMLDSIEDDARDMAPLIGRAAFAPAVMAAMGAVPRHRFVPAGQGHRAYVNRPLPIGHGQTISQPTIVALMTDLLDLAPTHRVLEIGTGCGYQTAVLARLAARVFSVETIPRLSEAAAARLDDLGIVNVILRRGDGAEGWPSEAPFDRIIVTAAPERIPPPLIDQLAPGGRMVIPLGRPWERQWLTVGGKDSAGAFTTRRNLPVAFVPLV